jgi:hypothetical protein
MIEKMNQIIKICSMKKAVSKRQPFIYIFNQG